MQLVKTEKEEEEFSIEKKKVDKAIEIAEIIKRKKNKIEKEVDEAINKIMVSKAARDWRKCC